MFTGIVREVGRVAEIGGGDEGIRLVIVAPTTSLGVEIGGSVAVDGVCLTAVESAGGRIAFDAIPETLRRTSLSRLQAGDEVNVEPALRAGDPLGGHYVQGHVDGVGRVRSIEPEGEGLRLVVDAPQEILRYCVEKGSIAVEGVSLTVAELHQQGFSVALVPHTLEATTLASVVPGRDVNLEVDIFAKYVERLLPRSG